MLVTTSSFHVFPILQKNERTRIHSQNYLTSAQNPKNDYNNHFFKLLHNSWQCVPLKPYLANVYLLWNTKIHYLIQKPCLTTESF